MNPECGFMAFAQSLINELEHDGVRLGTAHNYRSGLNSFMRFLESIRSEGEPALVLDDGSNGGIRVDSLGFDDITGSLMSRYSNFLIGNDLSAGTQSFYMRILQAIYNRGVNSGFCKQEFPFKHVYTGIPPTDNRAVDQKTLDQILALDLSGRPKLSLARDLFFFSFASCGMAFVDMAYLTKSNIRDGYIVYHRRKTKTLVKVRINDYLQMILDKYADPDSPYLLPILHSLGELERYKEYRRGINWFNRQLLRLSQLLVNPVKLTSYTARHTWANLAYQQLVALSVISTCLGHSSERMTRIYIASLNNAPCDEANKQLTGFLCGEPSDGKKSKKGKKSKEEKEKESTKKKECKAKESKEKSEPQHIENINNRSVMNNNNNNDSTKNNSNNANNNKKNNIGNNGKKVSNLLQKKRQNRLAEKCGFLCKKSSNFAAKIKRIFRTSKFSTKK